MSTPVSNSGYLAYLHGFRGVAILFIIGAHAWSILGAVSGVQDANPNYRWLYSPTETIFHGSTLFFALISGILFTRVMNGMPWKTFYRNKFRNVITPYLIITILLTTLLWPQYLEYGKVNGIVFFFPEELSKNIVFGQAEVHLWYIPVLSVLFALTPLLDRLRKPGNGIGLILLSLMPLIVSRSAFPDLISLKTIAFFLGAYAFGMFLGDRLSQLLALTQQHLIALLILLLASTTANFLLFLWDYTPTGFTSLHQSVVYLQKMLAAVLIIYALYHRQALLPKALMTLGTYAFSLYFLHFTFVWLLSAQFLKFVPTPSVGAIALAGLGIYVLSITGSLLLSLLIRKLLGRYSRYLIGT